MAAPRVQIQERDLSSRVPSFPGVYAGMCLPARKGPVDQPLLCTSESQFLSYFSPDERVEVGYDLGYYSAIAALQKTNKLWIQRVVGLGALYGGLACEDVTSATASAAWAAGEAIPTTHVFGANEAFTLYAANEGAWDANVTVSIENYMAAEVFTTAFATDDYTVTQEWSTGRAVYVSSATTLPAPLVADTVYYVIRVDATTIRLAASLALAIAGTQITLTDDGTGVHTIFPVLEPAKEVATFTVNVYQSSVLKETFNCSRDTTKKDGYGYNMYIEDVLLGSAYIRAYDNVLVASTVMPQEIITPTALAGGADGAVPTDSEMILALQTAFTNKEDKRVTLILDGGWATAGYHVAIEALCSGRQDCFGILSTPFALENTANYMNDLVNYRKFTANINSSYVGMYTSHVYITDKFNDRKIYVAPDGYAAAAISESASNYEIWYPPAGFRRGKVQVEDVRRRFTVGEMDLLYDNGINPIRFAPGKGIVIWGQKTMLAQPSDLQYMNVRLMLIVVEPAVAEALESFVFEINDTGTRSQVVSMIEDYMEGIKGRRGVSDYLVKVDEDNNLPTDISNRIMNVWLFVKPTADAEYINFTTIITNAGLSFSVAAQAV